MNDYIGLALVSVAMVLALAITIVMAVRKFTK